jgi:hypothetical protein
MIVVTILDGKIKMILTPETEPESVMLDALCRQSDCAIKLSDSPEHANIYGAGSIMIQ